MNSPSRFGRTLLLPTGVLLGLGGIAWLVLSPARGNLPGLVLLGGGAIIVGAGFLRLQG